MYKESKLSVSLTPILTVCVQINVYHHFSVKKHSLAVCLKDGYDYGSVNFFQ